MASLKSRGEQTLTIGSRSFKLKASFEALAGIEQDLNCGLLILMQRVGKGDIRLKDVAMIFWHCALAGGEKLEFKEAGKILLDNSYLQVAPKLLELMSESVTAGRDELPNDPTPPTETVAAAVG
jgi:hypothetical protein